MLDWAGGDERRIFRFVLFPFVEAVFARSFFFVDEIFFCEVSVFVDVVVCLLLNDFLLDILYFGLGACFYFREYLLPCNFAFFA